MVNRLTTSQNPILKRDLQEKNFLIKAEVKDQIHLIISYFSTGLEKMLFKDHVWNFRISIPQLLSQLPSSLQTLISSAYISMDLL